MLLIVCWVCNNLDVARDISMFQDAICKFCHRSKPGVRLRKPEVFYFSRVNCEYYAGKNILSVEGKEDLQQYLNVCSGMPLQNGSFLIYFFKVSISKSNNQILLCLSSLFINEIMMHKEGRQFFVHLSFSLKIFIQIRRSCQFSSSKNSPEKDN